MNAEIKKIRKFCCSTCGVEGHQKNNTKFHPKKSFFKCETCESKCDRLIEYCGLSGEEWNVCEDCEIKFDEERIQNIDDPDFPNVYPYKKCSVCEERSSCGSYNEDMYWICEGCAPEEDLDVDDERCFALRPDDDEEEENKLETKCGCEITINSREHDECRCDDDGENWICADCYNGEYDEDEDEDEEEEEEEEDTPEHCVCDFPKFQITDGIQSCRHCGLNDHYKNGIVDDWSDEDDDEEEEEIFTLKYTCPCCDNIYTDAQIESGEITHCNRCAKCYVGDCGLTCCYCFDEEYQQECGEGYCSICKEGCKLCYRIIDGEPDDTAPMCKYCLAKLEDEEEEDDDEDEDETCFKCGALGKFGRTHHLVIVNGVESMYCDDCDGDMIHCESCNEVGCAC